MQRKKEERYKNFSSEFRKAFAVKNKCEQLKLERQHKSLERLRAHENLDLLNKRREILSLQLSILSSKIDENTQGQEGEHLPPVTNINGTRNRKFRSRAVSISGSSINSIFKSSGKDNSRSLSSSLNSDSLGEVNQFKKMSRSITISGDLDCFKGRKFDAPQTDYNNNVEPETELGSSVDDSSSGQVIWKLLPPIQLTPLHKQKSKSLIREVSSKLVEPTRRLSVSRKGTSCSWKDLQDCRYLRRRWKDDSCFEQEGLAKE